MVMADTRSALLTAASDLYGDLGHAVLWPVRRPLVIEPHLVCDDKHPSDEVLAVSAEWRAVDLLAPRPGLAKFCNPSREDAEHDQDGNRRFVADHCKSRVQRWYGDVLTLLPPASDLGGLCAELCVDLFRRRRTADFEHQRLKPLQKSDR